MKLGSEMKWRSLSHVHSLWPHGLHSPRNSPGRNTRVGILSLLQEILPTQELNPGLPHCRWILYQLSYQGSPRILEWVAYPFDSRSSQPGNRTRVSCIAGGFFTNWAMREALMKSGIMPNAQCLCSLVFLWTTEIAFWFLCLCNKHHITASYHLYL